METQKQRISLTVSLFKFKTVYSKVKMFRGSKTIDGVKTKQVDIKTDWYVYYSYRNPYTDKMERFIVKAGINKINSVTERNNAIKHLQKGVTRWLQDGYNPFTERVEEVKEEEEEDRSLTIVEALKLSFTEKNKVWSESTRNSNKNIYKIFINWIAENNLSSKNIEDFTKRHISMFLNDLTTKKEITNITRNNYRRLIVSLIQQLVNDDIIKYNFSSSIPKLKEAPKKNKPFTKEQLVDIKNYLLTNDPYLYQYIQFIMYAFLRPIEVTRIKIKNIDLKRGVIEVKTKTEESSTVLIIDKLRSIIKDLNIENAKSDYYLFTNEFKPALWNTNREKSRTDFFIRRFKKLKNKLGLNENYGIYSFRHTFVLDLYNNFIKQGLTQLEAKHKLMTITRHKSMSGLENYLRDIGAILPKDYSSDYTVDF